MAATAHLKEVKSISEEIISDNWNNLENRNLDEWVLSLRQKAYAHVQEYGLPTPKIERFKYTNLPAFLKGMTLNFTDPDIQMTGNGTSDLNQLLQNTPDWLKEFLEAPAASEKKYDDMALWHVANAFLQSGLVTHIPKDIQEQKALEITITGQEGQFFSPRHVIRLDQHAELTIIEHHSGKGSYWNNQVTQIHLAAGARLRHYRMIEDSAESAYTQNTHIQMEAGANYEAFTLTNGCGLSRNQIHVELLGENAECTLNGANMLDGTQHGDTTITIEHKAPHCTSHQNYRNVLSGRSTGVFQGKVHVHQIAQKTDGYQLSNTLLLSDGAQMNTKPELEIYADDVKCSHGTTTGKLEDTPLFYLRSRGIPEEEARALLIQSFIGEIVEQIGDNSVQEIIEQKVLEWLKR